MTSAAPDPAPSLADAGQPASDASSDELVAWLNETSRGSLAERMGLRLLEVTPERTVGTLPVEGNTQPYGLLHGGASCVLAETLGSVAAAVAAGPGRVAVGVDINATHHRAARSGVVTGVCTPLRVGRTVGSYEIVVTDEDGERICTARLTALLRDAAPGA